MAVEARRGCGYRKVGGTYLVGAGAGVPCDRLPIPLTVCPTCSHGFKQARGWTWIDVNALVDGVHRNCADSFPCPLCMATSEMGRAGLLWIGERFYKTPADFIHEALTLGISRRIAAVPRDFKVGVTWVLLAHPKAVTCSQCAGAGLDPAAAWDSRHRSGSYGSPAACEKCNGAGKTPGIFRVFRPHAVEYIITQTQSKDPAFMADLQRKGLTPVTVPDNDRDHQGNVYDDDEPEPNQQEQGK